MDELQFYFYGHDHIIKNDKEKQTIIVNPGELGAQKSGVASFAVYDTQDNTATIIELKDTISLKSDLVDAYFKQHKEALDFRSAKSFKM